MSILGSLFYFDKNKELKFSVHALTNQFVTDCTLMIDKKKVTLIVRKQEHQGFNLNEGKFRLQVHIIKAQGKNLTYKEKTKEEQNTLNSGQTLHYCR